MKFNLFYMISLLSIPAILFAGYKIQFTYFLRIMGIILAGLFSMVLIDIFHIWWYGGIWISFGMAVYYAYMKAEEYASARRIFAEQLALSKSSLAQNGNDNVLLNEQIQSKEKGIEQSIHLYSIIKGLAETINWKSMVPTISRALRRFLNADEFALYLVDDRGSIRAYHRQGLWPLKIKLSRQISEPVFADFSWAVSSSPDETIPDQTLAVPFLNKNSVFCILLVHPENTGSTSDNALLDEASSLQVQLFFGIERAKLYHDIEMRSLIDGLTRLYRRQYFDVKLEEELSRARSFKTMFGLVMLDVDNFKKINDEYGHQTGDEILSRLGSLCKEHFYETDFCARYGGEEFVAICPRAEMEGLLRKMEGLRVKIEHDRIMVSGKEISVTVSIGIAHFPEHGQTVNEIIAEADRALYTAKNKGRNRVEGNM
ncbi:MAG: GGDEF domain-containing protein [bacterium]